jgi:hypothetical protein
MEIRSSVVVSKEIFLSSSSSAHVGCLPAWKIHFRLPAATGELSA